MSETRGIKRYAAAITTALSVVLTVRPACTDAHGLNTIATRLESVSGYAATVRYAVTLPQAEDDVVYTVSLEQPLATDYLIDWNTVTPSGAVSGFAAFTPGHFYCLRNQRLQEYHTGWDPAPLTGPQAVNHTTQFASLLPAEIALTLRGMLADSLRYDISVAPDLTEVKVRRLAATDMIDAELCYRFSAADGMPLEFSGEYNPGAISEQEVHAVYTPAEPTLSGPVTEAMLMERYTDAFTRCRTSNFAIENLPGKPLPPFSLPLSLGAGGERFTVSAASPLTSPTLLVLLNADATLSARLVDCVRAATASVPQTVDVVWAFAGRDTDTIASLLGPDPVAGETAVHGARRLAADCGAASLPVLVMTDSRGTVKFVSVGLNNQLTADVIKMITLTD